jgi:hypothetical protein
MTKIVRFYFVCAKNRENQSAEVTVSVSAWGEETLKRMAWALCASIPHHRGKNGEDVNATS